MRRSQGAAASISGNSGSFCCQRITLAFVLLCLGPSTICDAFVSRPNCLALGTERFPRHAEFRSGRLKGVGMSSQSQQEQTQPATSPSTAVSPPPMQLPDIEDLLGRDGIYALSNPVELKVFLFNFPEHIACIRVHAPWCKTCQSTAPHYKKLAKNLQQKQQPVVFADFNARHNQDFCRHVLDVTSFPTVLIYRAPSELLSTVPCGPSKIKKVKEALESCLKERKQLENMSSKQASEGRGLMSQIKGKLQSLGRNLQAE